MIVGPIVVPTLISEAPGQGRQRVGFGGCHEGGHSQIDTPEIRAIEFLHQKVQAWSGVVAMHQGDGGRIIQQDPIHQWQQNTGLGNATLVLLICQVTHTPQTKHRRHRCGRNGHHGTEGLGIHQVLNHRTAHGHVRMEQVAFQVSQIILVAGQPRQGRGGCRDQERVFFLAQRFQGDNGLLNPQTGDGLSHHPAVLPSILQQLQQGIRDSLRLGL